MKADIHPKYFECKVSCGCGNKFVTRATVKELHIEICSSCHPFYSGVEKFVDSAGRVDRFKKRYGDAPVAPKSAAAATAKAPTKAEAPKAAPKPKAPAKPKEPKAAKPKEAPATSGDGGAASS